MDFKPARFNPALRPLMSEVETAPLGHRRPDMTPVALGALASSPSYVKIHPVPPHQPRGLPNQQKRKAFRIPGLDYPQNPQRGSHDTKTNMMLSPPLDQHSHNQRKRIVKTLTPRDSRCGKRGPDKHSDLAGLVMEETDRSSPAQAGRRTFGEELNAGNGESEASSIRILERELHQKASTQSLLQQDPGKGQQIPAVGPKPLVQQQGSQDIGLNNMSPSQAGQHPRRKQRWNGGSTHAQRLHAWNAGPKTLSQSKLRALKEKSETDRSSLTRSERQKLGKHMKMEAGNKRDLTPGREVPQDRSNKKRKGRQPNPQGHHQPPDPRGNRIHGLPNAPPPSDNPYVQHPFHNPPPHSETTPPPAPTFKPSSIAELPFVPPAVEHIYQNNQPPPDPQTTPSLPPPTTHASTPHCLGCNVNLAEIERTTIFKYPDTCPLCHTPRMYLSEPRPPKAMLHQQIQGDPARLMLQQIEKWNQVCPVSQAGSVTEPYVPAAIVSEDRNANVSKEDNGVDEDRKVKRVKLAEEKEVRKEEGVGWVERVRFEDGISNDGYGEGDDDGATVDEEGWEQWEGAYEDDGEVSIKSEDEV